MWKDLIYIKIFLKRIILLFKTPNLIIDNERSILWIIAFKWFKIIWLSDLEKKKKEKLLNTYWKNIRKK